MTHPPFWQPALARAQLWRTALGIFGVIAVWLATSFVVLRSGVKLLGLPNWAVATGNTWPAAALFFLSFAGFHLGLFLVLPLLHRRGYTSLFGPSHRLELRRFAYGVAATLVIGTGLYALMAVERLVFPAELSPPLTQSQPMPTWLLGLAPALALILMQSLGEEMVFRGYLLQQLRARFRSAWIWAVLPSFIFGALHFDIGTYGPVNATAYVFNATVMGTLAAFITLRTGNLAAAAGLHFGNNAVLVLVGLEGHLAGFSLFTVAMDLTGGYTTYSILMQTAVMTLAYLLWWRWMNRHRPIAKPSGPA